MESRGLGLVEFCERHIALSEESMRGKWDGSHIIFNEWSLGLPD
jgi:hypothetical protein